MQFNTPANPPPSDQPAGDVRDLKSPLASELPADCGVSNESTDQNDSELRFVREQLASQIQAFCYQDQYGDFQTDMRTVSKHIPTYLKNAETLFQDGRILVVVRASYQIEQQRIDGLQAALQEHTAFPLEIVWVKDESLPKGQRNGGRLTALENGNGTQRTGRVPSHERFQRAVARSAPDGIDVLRSALYTTPLGPYPLHFASIKIHTSPEAESDVEPWARGLEERYGIGVVPHQVETPARLKSNLLSIADPDGLVRDPQAVTKLIHNIHGIECPNGTSDTGNAVIPANMTDLRSDPALSLDPSGARDLDDTLVAFEPMPDGSIRVRVNFVNAAWLVRAGSEVDQYVRRAGQSLYGQLTSLPLYGAELSYGQLSLLEGEDRFAFTVQMDIDPSGKRKNCTVFQSQVNNHFRLSYDHGQGILEGVPHEASEHLLRLVEPAKRLRKSRLGSNAFLKLERWGSTGQSVTSHTIVEEFMIAARMSVAEFCVANSIPTLFRVHNFPTRQIRQELLREVQAKGIPATMGREFTRATDFSAMLSTLREQREFRLASRILDTYMGRSRFDVTQRRHDGLNADAYTEIKARHEAGLLMQRQLERFLAGHHPKARSTMRGFQGGVNSKRRTLDEKQLELIQYERIRRAVEHLDQPLEAKVTSSQDGRVLLRMPDFHWRASALMEARLDSAQAHQVGETLRVAIEGHSPQVDRLIVRPAA